MRWRRQGDESQLTMSSSPESADVGGQYQPVLNHDTQLSTADSSQSNIGVIKKLGELVDIELRVVDEELQVYTISRQHIVMQWRHQDLGREARNDRAAKGV